MTLKSLVPFAGKKSVRKKLRDIEDETPTLPLIFASLFMKVFESLVTGDLIMALKFGLASFAAIAAHVYRVEAKKALAEGKEKAEEVIEGEE